MHFDHARQSQCSISQVPIYIYIYIHIYTYNRQMNYVYSHSQLLATSQKNQNVTLWKVAVDIHDLNALPRGGRILRIQQGLTTSGGKKIESLTTVGWWKMQASYSCSFLMQKILKGLRKKFDYIWLYNSSTTLDELKTTHKHSAKQKKHPSNQTTFTADST